MSQFIFPPLTASLDSEASSGAALPSAQIIVGGFYSAGSVVYPIAVDAAGQLQVDVLSTTGPSNYATDTLQTTGNGILTTIDADTGSLAGCVSGTEIQVDVLTSALPSGAATSAKQDTIETPLTAIETDADTIAGAVSGTEMQVDVLTSALPSGAATSALQTTANGILTTIDADTGSIAGAISGTEMQVDVLTSALPSGAATSALQTSSEALLTTIDADTSLLAGAISGTEMQVDVLSLPADSKNYVWKEGLDSTIGGITNTILDTSTTNIPSGTQLTVATLTNDIYEIQTVEDIGEFIGIYAASALKAILPLGGGSVKINLPSTTVVKLASFSGTAIASGKIAINFLG